jgi:hypothetical protein
MKRLAKPTNQLPQKTLRGLASGLTKGRCVLSIIKRAPIGATVSLLAKIYFAGNRSAALISARETTVCEEAVFVLACSHNDWAFCAYSFGCGYAALGSPW